MAKPIAPRTFDEAVTWLRSRDFELLEAPGTANRIFLKKHKCSAAIEKTQDGGVRIFAYPGNLIGGEIAKLVDRGYQKFLKTSKSEISATAEHLKALRQIFRAWNHWRQKDPEIRPKFQKAVPNAVSRIRMLQNWQRKVKDLLLLAKKIRTVDSAHNA